MAYTLENERMEPKHACLEDDVPFQFGWLLGSKCLFSGGYLGIFLSTSPCCMAIFGSWMIVMLGTIFFKRVGHTSLMEDSKRLFWEVDPREVRLPPVQELAWLTFTLLWIYNKRLFGFSLFFSSGFLLDFRMKIHELPSQIIPSKPIQNPPRIAKDIPLIPDSSPFGWHDGTRSRRQKEEEERQRQEEERQREESAHLESKVKEVPCVLS